MYIPYSGKLLRVQNGDIFAVVIIIRFNAKKPHPPQNTGAWEFLIASCMLQIAYNRNLLPEISKDLLSVYKTTLPMLS